ncbi:MAG: acetyl-CoA carboxylase carboxyltransferase subunit alpha [Planctomycetota bacterium]
MPAAPLLPFERPIAQLEEKLAALEADPDPSSHIRDAIRALRKEIRDKTQEIFGSLDAAQTVKVARHAERPQTRDYIELVFDEFVELHGDRAFGDDRAILTGFAKLDGQRVLLVGQQKGRTLKERTECFYGCAHPEGYRKALEKMRLAEKFGLPIVCLIDTPGAYPGVGAEERGQSYAIALNLREMARLKTPIVCCVIGEGGSGGALGIAIGDHVAAMQFSYYSVISPEGCAGILYRNEGGATPENVDRAANALKFTSDHLLEFGIVEEVVEEPPGGAHRDHRIAAAALKESLSRAIRELADPSPDALLERRYERFRKIGLFEEAAAAGEEPPAAEPAAAA